MTLKAPTQNKKSTPASLKQDFVRYSEFYKLVVRVERLEKLFEQKVKTMK